MGVLWVPEQLQIVRLYSQIIYIIQITGVAELAVEPKINRLEEKLN